MLSGSESGHFKTPRVSKCLGGGLRAVRSAIGVPIFVQRAVSCSSREDSSVRRLSFPRRRRMALALRRILEISWRTCFGHMCRGRVPFLGGLGVLRGNILVASVKASLRMVWMSLARPMTFSSGIWEFDRGSTGDPLV